MVIVTGSNGGIGKSICEIFKKNDWFVIGIDICNNLFGINIDRFININITKENEVKDLFGSIKRLDCIVNNAALQICKSMEDMSIDEFKAVLDTNLVAPFILTKYSIPYLKTTGGSVVNIGSVHSIQTSANISGYACSKAGIVGLTRNMAIELSKYGIRVNCVSPGAIHTNMLLEGLKRSGSTIESFGKTHPIGRVGLPDEIANMVFFLADSTKSGFTTGSNFVIDGGATCKLSTE